MVTPYRRTGLMTASFQGARGAALSEGIRSADALSSQLSQMSNFFFNQAAQQRRIEGEEFGAANAPTFEELLEAQKQGENLLDFAPTVFGRSAKAAALATVENEITVDAQKRFDQLAFEANKKMVSPTVLRDDLDATILGYSEVLQATSPALVRKLSAKLSLNANNIFDSYRKSYARASAQKSTLVNVAALSVAERNTIDAWRNYLDVPNLTVDQVMQAEVDLKLIYQNELTKNGAKTTKSDMNRIDNTFRNIAKAKVQNFLVNNRGNLSFNIDAIRRGIGVKGIDPQDVTTPTINGIINFLTDEERNAIITTSLASFSAENALIQQQDDAYENAQKAANETLLVETLNVLSGNPFELEDGTKIIPYDEQGFLTREASDLLDNLANEVLNSGAEDAEQIYNDIIKSINDADGKVSRSEPRLKRQLAQKISSGGFSYQELATFAPRLTVKDLAELKTLLDGVKNEDLEIALNDGAEALNNYVRETEALAFNHPRYEDQRLYLNYENYMSKKLKKAERGGEPFDAEEAKNEWFSKFKNDLKSEFKTSYISQFNRITNDILSGSDSAKVPKKQLGQNLSTLFENILKNTEREASDYQEILKELRKQKQNNFNKNLVFQKQGPILIDLLERLIENMNE